MNTRLKVSFLHPQESHDLLRLLLELMYDLCFQTLCNEVFVVHRAFLLILLLMQPTAATTCKNIFRKVLSVLPCTLQNPSHQTHKTPTTLTRKGKKQSKRHGLAFWWAQSIRKVLALLLTPLSDWAFTAPITSSDGEVVAALSSPRKVMGYQRVLRQLEVARRNRFAPRASSSAAPWQPGLPRKQELICSTFSCCFSESIYGSRKVYTAQSCPWGYWVIEEENTGTKIGGDTCKYLLTVWPICPCATNTWLLWIFTWALWKPASDTWRHLGSFGHVEISASKPINFTFLVTFLPSRMVLPTL